MGSSLQVKENYCVISPNLGSKIYVLLRFPSVAVETLFYFTWLNSNFISSVSLINSLFILTFIFKLSVDCSPSMIIKHNKLFEEHFEKVEHNDAYLKNVVTWA